ncbi:MAG: type II toxin-antitoxin system HicB family antitoxin [Rhodoplanes sp.]
MSTHAIAIVHEEAGVYGIAFADLPGCIAAGDSLDEVLQRGAARRRRRPISIA